MLFATSCQDDLGIDTGNEALVSFNVTTPEMSTRAYGDGETATVLQYAVYQKNAQNELVEIEALTKSIEKQNAGTIAGSTTVKLNLLTGDTYSIIFWAAATNAPYSVNFGTQTMTVNYAGAVSNDENRDAFYACKEFTVNGAQSVNVELTRPFAQLNIGTADYATAEAVGFIPTKSTVTVKQVYSTLNLATGAVDNEVEANFGLADIKKDETFPVADNEYLAMNYLLVGTDKETVNVEFTVKDETNGKEKTRTVGSVPVQRNYRTNIYGNILTSDVDVNVEIKPGFGENDENVYVWDGSEVSEPQINANGEYEIKLASELAWLAAAVNGTLTEDYTRATVAHNDFIGKTFILTQDIYLGDKNWTPISMSTKLSNGETFRGTFDGQGHTIKGLSSTQKDAAGLFGYLYAATIKNVTVEGATLNSNHCAGCIVAWVLNNEGNIQVPMIIENCHVKNSTIASTPELVNGEWDNGDKVGGLVGYAVFEGNTDAKISNCSVENTSIKAYRDFAGFVGYAKDVTLENCTIQGVTIEQDLTHDYKAPNTPTTFGEIFGRNEGGNTIDGNEYVTDGVTKDAGGNYHVFNAAGLKFVAENVNTMEFYVNQAANIFDGKTVYLEKDIDLGGMEWTPIGDYAFSRTSFNGVFDGQNHTVSNFNVTEPVKWTEKVTEASYGFFGNVKGTIKNLTIKNATVNPEGGRYTAVLVGRLHNGGKIENCHVENSSATILHWQVGGIVGQNNNGNISGCSVVGSTITGKAAVGAIVGMDMAAGEHTIENCRIANTALVQNESFGDSYDASYGLAVGLVNAAGIILHLNDVAVVNNTIKGVDANTLIGDKEEGAKIYVNGATAISTAEALSAALQAGGEYILMNDVAMTEAIYQNVDFTLDGNGYTISQVEGSTNTNALFDSVTGKITLKNVAFAGIKGGAVIRTIGAEATFDNVTVEGAVTTQQQGLFRLIGKSTIKNCTFKNNTCSMVITLNYDGANNDPQVVENCVFEGNTCNGTAALYYVKGASATINGNKFVGNTVNCNTNGATVYMGFQENCVITNNLFKNNTVNESNTSSRVAGGVFFGYDAVFTGNAFVGNNVTGENAVAKDVCVSTYYTSINLSGNYWGGNAPEEDVNYFVQHKSDERVVIINDYLTVNPFN